MAPKIKKNDLVILIKTEKNSLISGDIVAVDSNNSLLVHRIDNIKTFALKGDCNLYYDEIDENCKLVGKYIFKVPLFGYILKVFQNSIVLIISIILLIIIFIQNRKNIKLSKKRKRIKIKEKEINC